MEHQALIEVVKNQLAGGVSKSEIKEFLRRRGTADADVEQIFAAISAESVDIADIPVMTQESPKPSEGSAIIEQPATTIAHGIERPIPPLSPSIPYTGGQPSSTIAPERILGQPGVSIARAPFWRKVFDGRKKSALIAVAGVLLIAGSAWGYYAYTTAPDRVFANMLGNLSRVRSAEFSGEVVITISNINSEQIAELTRLPFVEQLSLSGPITVTDAMHGSFDTTDSVNPKLSIVSELRSDKWPFGNFTLGGEYRSCGSDRYFKIDSVPDLGAFNLSFLKNKWFKTVSQEVAGESTIASAAMGDVIKQRAPLTIIETMRGEQLDGVSAYRYKVALRKEAIKDIVAVIYGDALPGSQQRQLLDNLDRFSIDDAQLWVGKSDLLPHKLYVRATMTGAGDPVSTTELSVTLAAKNYNQPQDIAIPEGAQAVDDTFTSIATSLAGVFKPATTPAERNAQRASNIKKIADAIAHNAAAHGGIFVCDAGPLPVTPTFMGLNSYHIAPCLAQRLAVLPQDPQKGTPAQIGYSLFYDPRTKKLTVRAPYAELQAKISISTIIK